MNDTDVAYTTLHLARTGYVPDNDSAIRRALYKSVDFAPEDDCEADPDRRELVVYTVVWRRRSGRPEVLVGQRQPDAGEGRLHGDYFLGWGGHVERQDSHPVTPKKLFRYSVRREIREELDASPPKDGRSRIDYHGILNDPSDAVGKDHIGLVYSVQVADATVRERDKYGKGEWWAFPGDRWISRECEFESWSRLLLDHMGELTGGDR